MDISLRRHTDHGARRMQQRAISQEDIERVLRYGRREYKHQAVRYTLDNATRRRMEREEGGKAIAVAGNKLNIYAVVSLSGALITAGYRKKRLKR